MFDSRPQLVSNQTRIDYLKCFILKSRFSYE